MRKMFYRYSITGLVFGRDWMFQKCFYPLKSSKGDNLKELIACYDKIINNHILEYGDFECITGMLLNIETITYVVFNDLTYSRSTYKRKYIGNLTQKEKMFLYRQLYYI